MSRADDGPARTVLAAAGVVGLAVALGSGAVLLRDAADPAAGRPVVDAPEAVLPEPENRLTDAAEAGRRPDPVWVGETAERTGVPERAMRGYASAALRVADEQPDCGLGWNTLAAIGQVESLHGSISDSSLDAEGIAMPPITGIPLDGDGVARIPDTDGGVLDGDRTWDRAVGPMQFIPTTWARWGADGNGDGVADPQNIDDATLAAARYLCSGDRSLAIAEEWTAAVLSYNNSLEYAAQVAGIANAFAR